MNKSNIQIKTYKQQYLSQIIEGWNRTLIYDPISDDRFIDMILLDENFDENLTFVALDEDQVVGFLLGMKRKVPYLSRGLEEKKAWISVMYVVQEYQGQGIGKALLNSITDIFKEKGTEEITLCAYSPNYFTPGIDVRYGKAVEFFERNGYRKTDEAVSMQRDLWDYVLPETEQERVKELYEQGIAFVSYREDYREKLLQFITAEFDGGWKRNVLIVMQKRIAEETIILCLEQDEVIGFCMRKIDGLDSRFGPIGIMSSKRNMHLGSTLMSLMMHDMKKRGIYYLYFLWTSGNAIRFYERLGLSTYRRYQMFRKEV